MPIMTQMVVFECDSKPCSGTPDGKPVIRYATQNFFHEALSLARMEGWAITGQECAFQSYCPACSAKKEAATDAEP